MAKPPVWQSSGIGVAKAAFPKAKARRSKNKRGRLNFILFKWNESFGSGLNICFKWRRIIELVLDCSRIKPEKTKQGHHQNGRFSKIISSDDGNPFP
jgi:hypothetical protein